MNEAKSSIPPLTSLFIEIALFLLCRIKNPSGRHFLLLLLLHNTEDVRAVSLRRLKDP